MLGLLVFLGLGTVIFGVLTVTFSSKAASVQKSADQQKTAAAASAAVGDAKCSPAATRAATLPPSRITA